MVYNSDVMYVTMASLATIVLYAAERVVVALVDIVVVSTLLFLLPLLKVNRFTTKQRQKTLQ